MSRHKDPEYQKKYYQLHKEKLIARTSANQAEHKDERRVYLKNYMRERRRTDPVFAAKHRASKVLSRKKNRAQIRAYEANLYKTNPNYKLAKNLRSRLTTALKHGRGAKSASTLQLLGCTVDELKVKLESRFHPGMTWDNYGEWHVDHIKPCASFDLSDPAQQQLCFHWTNLQPLWALENLQKSDKLAA